MRSKLELALAFQIRAAGLITPVVEFKAIPARRYRWDFAWPGQKLLVEVQGGIWAKGAEKLNLATLAGYRCITVTGEQIKSGQALQLILQALSPDSEGGVDVTDDERAMMRPTVTALRRLADDLDDAVEGRPETQEAAV